MMWVASVEILAWVVWVHKILAWVKKMACVVWVHKIGVGQNFGMGNMVVQMWFHKIFFKFLSFFFSITTTKTYSSFNI